MLHFVNTHIHKLTLLLPDSQVCSVHPVYRRVSVKGTDATVEWEMTKGLWVILWTIHYLPFTCQLDDNAKFRCKYTVLRRALNALVQKRGYVGVCVCLFFITGFTPLTLTGLSRGSHHLTITPDPPCKKRQIPGDVWITVR